MSGDELDAVAAALVGQLFLRGKAEVLGNFRRGADWEAITVKAIHQILRW